MVGIHAGAVAPDHPHCIHILPCDSPGGGGKTYGMAQYAARSVRRTARKFVVAQPTIALIDETAALLRSIDPVRPTPRLILARSPVCIFTACSSLPSWAGGNRQR